MLTSTLLITDCLYGAPLYMSSLDTRLPLRPSFPSWGTPSYGTGDESHLALPRSDTGRMVALDAGLPRFGAGGHSLSAARAIWLVPQSLTRNPAPFVAPLAPRRRHLPLCCCGVHYLGTHVPQGARARGAAMPRHLSKERDGQTRILDLDKALSRRLDHRSRSVRCVRHAALPHMQSLFLSLARRGRFGLTSALSQGLLLCSCLRLPTSTTTTARSRPCGTTTSSRILPQTPLPLTISQRLLTWTTVRRGVTQCFLILPGKRKDVAASLPCVLG